MRLFDEAVRDVTLDVPKGLPIKDRKQQRRLKQRLLRKQLQPILTLVFKAFSPGYESLCVLLLEGIVSQLQDGAHVIQTTSVLTLARRLQRFITKHQAAINTLLQLAVEQGTPTTTNALESKNGLLKPFSRIAKFFPLPARCQLFFAGVALMENFDVKTRGLIAVPAPCSGHRSTWMTSEPPISSPLSAYRSHKYLWLVSRSRVPSRCFLILRP